MHISFYNVGGNEGVYLPQNMLTWGVAVIVTALIAGEMPHRVMHMTATAWLLLAGVALLTLPVLWCPERDWLWLALPRLAGLWGGVIFYIALLQCHFSKHQKKALLWSLTFAALWEVGNVWAGLLCPSLLSETAQRFIAVNGRGALGTFQQVNVTSSFLATGFAVFAGLFCTGFLIPSGRKRDLARGLKAAYLLSGLFFIPCTLILTMSRIGWVGVGAVYLIAVVATLHHRLCRQPDMPLKRIAALLMVPLVGVFAGICLLDVSVVKAVSHSGSNYQRLLTLKTTWEMIRQHPWQGWGLGSFRMQFQHYMASRYPNNPSHELMGHPHNEVFYAWVEGGVVALTGIIVLGWAGIRLLVHGITYPRLMTGMALLPVALHTQVEFPLYYSAAHALILLMVMACLDVPSSDCQAKKGNPAPREGVWGSVGMRIIVVTGCIWMLFSLAGSLQSGFILSRYEEQALQDNSVIKHLDVPWLLHSRYEYDLITEGMLEYSTQGDERILDQFLHKNSQWLGAHTEPDSYANQVDVLRYLLREREACGYETKARQLYPWDKRFSGDCLPDSAED